MSEDGFLSRWSRRKQQVREGAPLPAEPPRAPAAPQAPAAVAAVAPGAAPAPQAAAPAEPPPTLDDVQSLTPQSDFSRFVAPGVDPGVKNAALKKLFADPHFNVMDRLDVYIDDYSRPDPLPLSMARQLAGAQFLRIFDTPEEEAAREAGREVADRADAPSVAQSQAADAARAAEPTESHADPDLRLQQDDAPGPEGPGAGAR